MSLSLVMRSTGAMRHRQPDMGLTMLGEKVERLRESIYGVGWPLHAQQHAALRMERVHRVLASIHAMRLGKLPFAFQFPHRFFDIILRETNHPKQPVKAKARQSL